MNNASRTQRRNDNLRMLILALRDGPLLRDQIRDLLGFTRAAAGSYTLTLLAAGVIVRHVGRGAGHPGQPQYRLKDDGAVIDAFLAALAESKPVTVRRTTPAAPRDEAHHIHRIADDSYMAAPQQAHRIPPPDPLLAAFYGMPRLPRPLNAGS